MMIAPSQRVLRSAINPCWLAPLGERMPAINDVPISIWFHEDSNQYILSWLNFSGRKLCRPFFRQDVSEQLAQVGLDNLKGAELFDSLAHMAAVGRYHHPNGFIFHASHCGSTLTVQLLRAISGAVVVSEPEVVNQVLGMSTKMGHEISIKCLRMLLPILCATASGKTYPRYSFVKFTSWNILFLRLLREAFPAVPWIFLFRDPVEIMVSLVPKLKRRPDFPRLRAIDLEISRLGYPPRNSQQVENNAAKLIDIYFRSALEMADQASALVNYPDIKECFPSIARWGFSVPLDKKTLHDIKKAGFYDAKNPDKGVFVSDALNKQLMASDDIRAAVKRWVDVRYEQLLRASHSVSG